MRVAVVDIFTPDAGFASDPQLAAHNLAVAVQARGAELLFGRTVTGVPRRGSRARGVVLAGGERIEAPGVVNAAGPSRVTRVSCLLTGLAVVVDRPTADPVRYACEHTGASINLGALSRRRAAGGETSGTVMG